MNLTSEECYQALSARDARFDGHFFVGVKTTEIYCRSICPARTPRASSCLFFATAAAAEKDGFRPCLRCRPEVAPAIGGESLESALFAAIRSRAVESDSVEELAHRTGFSTRQLRRLTMQAFGVAPVDILQTERLLFAKKLLQETALPMTDIALSAGFGSLRRFNALFRSRYALSPTDLRRRGASSGLVSPDTLRLRLSYRPPLAWRELLEYLARRAVPSVERIELATGCFTRTVRLGAITGWVRVEPASQGAWLEVTLPATLVPQAWASLARLRALFDLDANPLHVEAHLRRDPLLAPSIDRHPGLRVPGAWSTFELAVRAVLGQQVSVVGATTLARRLAEKFGERIEPPAPGLDRLAPEPQALIDGGPEAIATIGLPRARALGLHALAVAARDGLLDFSPSATVEEAIARLRQIRGIGEWTAQYVVMRALRFPDAFPAADLGVRKVLGRAGQPLPSEREVLLRAAPWRPFRAYATLHLWQMLHDQLPT